MARKSNQVLRPSGLSQSPDGKYIYAACVVTGKKTFFKPDYFVKVLARYGGDEVRMAKEFVVKDVQVLRKQGKTDDYIRQLLSIEGVKPVKEAKAPKVKAEKASDSQIGSEKTVRSIKTRQGDIKVTEEKPIYAWSSDPQNYFRGGVEAPAAIEDVTKESCLYPNRHLDDQCEGCPALSRCQCHLKIDDEARAKLTSRGRPQTKIKRMVFDEQAADAS